MQITTLNQDIDTLLKGWPPNHPLASDGGDGEPVFKKLYSLASEEAIAQMKENMTTSQAQISFLSAELAALFR
jgi:hypothetical protein